VRILKTLAFWQKMMYCIVNMKKIQKIIITTISAIILAVQSGALAFAEEAGKAKNNITSKIIIFFIKKHLPELTILRSST
jgi:hypothetical protein